MPNQKTILLKLSGDLFASPQQAVDLTNVLKIAKQIKPLYSKYQLAVVCGAGNIFRGRQAQELNWDMPLADLTGMTATLVNALALKNAFNFLKLPNRIISALDYSQVLGASSKLSLKDYLQRGEILIFAAGTGQPFVTTDTAAVIQAVAISADMVLKATQVKGIYNFDPRQNKSAKQYKKISYDDFLALSQTTIFDKTATLLAAEHQLPVYFFKWGAGQLKLAAQFKAGGTLMST